ncbi:hypothetical protein OC846_005499 [Tilletia horrida]|uniref:Thioredoxin-like fold domain-containing protein n=1 Tax=Tilletia horrida TaxID=155126 RepID=A0AAN6GMV0_9BASI|nr:hypothetical protein OC846_005499 [Tilletia horrida]KAK0551545.1 hypothetical protein OC845_002125 [Tilletia horrida]KAK0569522.1 hypothetical protein OC861_000895 [Tilletia horrida]
MALPPNLASLALGKATAQHTLEFWLDYVCPFSAKQLFGLQEHVFPLIFGQGAKYQDRVKLVIRPIPQPWHATSTYTHEAALASTQLSPAVSTDDVKQNGFWLTSLALMREQKTFFDVPAKDKTAEQIRDELSKLVSEALSTVSASDKPVNAKADDVRALLTVQGDGNAGSKVIPDLKYCVKMGRQNSIHVTPSVTFNGLLVSDISSSFGAKEWQEWLEKNVGTESKL